jgi:hypothetical protein
MQWSNEPNAGFTKSDKPLLPVISGGPYGFEQINAAIQRRHPEALLNWTERIIRMRKEVPEIGWGEFAIVPNRDSAVLIIRYDWRNNSVLFIHNLDSKPREIAFSTGPIGEGAATGRLLVNLLSDDHSRTDKHGRHRFRRGPGREPRSAGPRAASPGAGHCGTRPAAGAPIRARTISRPLPTRGAGKAVDLCRVTMGSGSAPKTQGVQ